MAAWLCLEPLGLGAVPLCSCSDLLGLVRLSECVLHKYRLRNSSTAPRRWKEQSCHSDKQELNLYSELHWILRQFSHKVTFPTLIFCLPPSRAPKGITWASPCQATQWISLRWQWPRLGRTWPSWRSSLMPTMLFSCWWTLGRVAGCLLSLQPARGRYWADPFTPPLPSSPSLPSFPYFNYTSGPEQRAFISLWTSLCQWRDQCVPLVRASLNYNFRCRWL